MSEHSDNEDRIGFFDQSPRGDLLPNEKTFPMDGTFGGAVSAAAAVEAAATAGDHTGYSPGFLADRLQFLLDRKVTMGAVIVPVDEARDILAVLRTAGGAQ